MGLVNRPMEISYCWNAVRIKTDKDEINIQIRKTIFWGGLEKIRRFELSAF